MIANRKEAVPANEIRSLLATYAFTVGLIDDPVILRSMVSKVGLICVGLLDELEEAKKIKPSNN